MNKVDSDKARRLAEALRQNLRRRKAQARGSLDPAESQSDADRDGEDGGQG